MGNRKGYLLPIEEDKLIGSKLGHGQLEVIHRYSRKSAKNKNIFMYVVECSICKLDSELFGYGIFNLAKGCIVKNQLPCGCSPSPQWTKEQNIIRAKREAIKRQHSYLGYVGDWKGINTIVSIACDSGHQYDIKLHSFLCGQGCRGCATHGFNTSKPAYLYVLLLSNGIDSFVGYGVTNSLKIRLKEHKRNLKRSGYYFVAGESVYLKGSEALDIETKIKHNFPLYSKDISGFVKESTYPEYFQNVVKFVKTISNKYK